MIFLSDIFRYLFDTIVVCNQNNKCMRFPMSRTFLNRGNCMCVVHPSSNEYLVKCLLCIETKTSLPRNTFQLRKCFTSIRNRRNCNSYVLVALQGYSSNIHRVKKRKVRNTSYQVRFTLEVDFHYFVRKLMRHPR